MSPRCLRIFTDYGTMQVKHWPVSDTGLKYDRMWSVVTSKGISLTQKRCTQLCLITPAIDEQNQMLTLHAPGILSYLFVFIGHFCVAHCPAANTRHHQCVLLEFSARSNVVTYYLRGYVMAKSVFTCFQIRSLP